MGQGGVVTINNKEDPMAKWPSNERQGMYNYMFSLHGEPIKIKSTCVGTQEKLKKKNLKAFGVFFNLWHLFFFNKLIRL